MEEFQVMYSKAILIKAIKMDFDSMKNEEVSLEIDAGYTIGKSVAVLFNGQVTGHLTRYAARPIWMHLKGEHKINARIYGQLENGFKNSIRYSPLTKSPEVGIEICIFFVDTFDGSHRISGGSDAKLFLAHIIKHRLNCFTVSNCPPELKHFIN